MAIFGVDVSEHNGTNDWAAVKAAGISFGIARAVICTKPDPYYAGNIAGMRASGILPGAYHFLYPSWFISAEAQADAFMAKIGSPEGLLIALDVESDGGGSYKPTIDDVRRWISRFRTRYPTHPLIIYSGRWYWRDTIGNPAGAGLGFLWNSWYVAASQVAGKTAQWVYANLVPSTMWAGYGGWSQSTILQFSSSVSVPGIGTSDVNAYRGTIDDLRKFATSSGVVDPTPDVVDTEEIVKSFPAYTFPVWVTVKAGSWLSNNSDLSTNDVKVGSDRQMPYFGKPGTSAMVVYIPDTEPVPKSSRVMFTDPANLSTTHPFVLEDGVSAADVEAIQMKLVQAIADAGAARDAALAAQAAQKAAEDALANDEAHAKLNQIRSLLDA